LEDKDACQEDPFVGETQAFSTHNGIRRKLIRTQRKDGSWTDWSGHWRDEVAAAGFKPCVEPVASNAGSASQVNHDAYRPSSAYMDLFSQGSGSILDPMQPSQGPDIQHVAAQAGYRPFPTLSTDQVLTNAHHHAMSLPMQQPEQTELFPTCGQVSGWSLGSAVFPSTASSPYPNAASLSESNLFDNGFMAPLQTSPPSANATGTSANTFDFSSLPFEAMSGDLCMPANGAYTPAETSQAMPENTNAGNGGECWDSFANHVFDDAMWSPPHGTSGW
jgi:hypothetical protein